jgi:hypothetical protein
MVVFWEKTVESGPARMHFGRPVSLSFGPKKETDYSDNREAPAYACLSGAQMKWAVAQSVQRPMRKQGASTPP